MKDFSTKLKGGLRTLSIKQLVLFCNLNCEKMLPGYEVFSKKENWGDYAFFKNTIELVYDQLDGMIEERNYQQLYETLELNSPDLEEFDDPAASYALDVCSAFEGLIQFLITKDIEQVFNNSEYCINTVDMFIQQKEGITYISSDNLNRVERIIAQDAYMIRELKRQSNVLMELSKNNEINKSTITSLRELNNSFNSIIDYNLL